MTAIIICAVLLCAVLTVAPCLLSSRISEGER